MKRSLLALALTASSAVVTEPAPAITFANLTTIYVGSGVVDNGAGIDTGVATTFTCSNVSGFGASVRFLVLYPGGQVAAQATANLPHGGQVIASTHDTALFQENLALATGLVQGTVNIEATQSAVFCTAAILDATGPTPTFALPLHLVRVNSHPGTAE